MIDSKFNQQTSWIFDIQRVAIAVIENIGVRCLISGCGQSIANTVLSLLVHHHRQMTKCRVRQLWAKLGVIFGVAELEECQCRAIANIEKAFSQGDPDNAEIYKANAAAYIEKLDLAMEPLRAALDAIPPEDRWLVSSEGAFSYLARDFGLKELFIWPINADQQGSPRQVKAIIDAVRENNIGVVFSESTIPPDPAQQIARETDAVYGGVLYVDSLSKEDGPVPTYIDLMTVTVETIAKELGKRFSLPTD